LRDGQRCPDCQFAGGAILAGSLTGDDLTLSNVVMSNNGANPTGTGVAGQEGGGAIEFDTPPNLTITGSTFTSNTASAAGGAIEFKGSGNGGGNLSVTNSTFTSNTAVIDGGGISIVLATGFSATISGSTFTGNSVTESTGLGGGIFAEQGGTLTVSNSRIVGNSAFGGKGAEVDASTAGTLINNWWGCNAGPGNTGCDSVEAQGGGTATFTPVLTLKFSISTPLTTLPNLTFGEQALLSSGGTCTGYFDNECYVPDGTPVSFNAGTLATISSASPTFSVGAADVTFLAGGTPGNDTVTATVDNQTVSETVNIQDTVTVDTSPTGLSVTVDSTSYTAPQTFHWTVGSTHTLNTTSPQNVSGGSEQVWSSWSQGGTQSQTVTAGTAAITYTANFTTQYQLTMVASPSADGSVTPASGGYYASGASIPVTATANSGFAFNNWTSTGGTFDSTSSASTNFHMPAAATTVTGNFVPATTQITIATSPANLLVSVDGGPLTAAPLVETWNQNSTHTIATTSPQSGGTGIQYAFSAWSDLGAISHTITVPATATTYTASFATQYQLTTAGNPSAGGTVSPTSGNYYTSGTIVPLVATANAGYSFTNWTGNVANSTSATTSITMTAPQSVTANFSLIIVAAPTTTSVSSNNNPSFTSAPGNSVTFTATVTSNSTVNEGTVTFSDPANDFTCSGGNTVPVSNGQATCTTSFSTEGSRNVTATYNGTVNFQTSNGFITQTVNNHTVVTGNQFCNQGAITVPSTAGAATPYPSNIFVTGLSGNIGAVTVNLNNISSSDIAQTDLLLVGPTGAQIIPFASVGDGSAISGVNVTLDDSASSLIPGGSPLTTGTYKPTSITGSTSLVFPAPAPLVTAGNYAATDGPATLTSTFQNTAPNGTWALYAMDSLGSGPATIGGGWCVNISPATVQTTITTSPAGLLVSVDGGTATTAPLVENWAPGSSHTITTTSPQSGGTGVQYVFSSWSDSGAISHSITVPSTATTYTATFNTQYQLTTQASPPADGSVTPASGSYYAAGATIPVTATANAGFAFSNWTSTGGTFDSTTAASTNFHMPSAPATVTGNFGAATVQITITTTPANLLVSVDGGTATTAPLVETWNIGSSHTIATSSPQAGGTGVQYVFSSWSDSGAISHSITVPSTATTYTAAFNTQYQLTTQASPAADGSVTPASGSYYAAGATIPVTATANAGFAFSNWTSTGGTFDSTTAASTNFHMPAAPATVTGNFGAATVQITITTSPANLLVSVDGGTATTAPLVETWNIGSSHTIATTSPQAGGTGVQYVWSNWSDSGAISHSITVPSTATTYTATFNTQYQLTTQASPPADGSVTPASGSYYAAGATIPVTATANAGFAFSNWSATGGTFDSTTTASTNFHMPSAPATVTGNFSTINDFSIAANPTSLSLVQGASGTSTISTAVTAGSAGTVSLVVGGVPSGASAMLNPTSVTAGGSSTLMMNAGTATPGTYTLTVTGMEGSKTHSATVSLTVTAAAQLSVTPTNINFGTVRQYSLLLRNVTVKNTGTSTVSISKVSVTPGTGADSDDFTPISLCKSSLAPGKSCIITVAFFADNLGTLNATLYITDNATGSPQAVTLTGIVTKGH
jgi:hypothetical protein